MTTKNTSAPTRSSRAAMGISVLVTGPSVFRSRTTDSEGAGAVASAITAKDKGRIDRHPRACKEHAKDQTHHHKGPPETR